MKQKLVMNKTTASGTSLQGYMPDEVTYDDLVKVFGEPEEGDGYKVDAEWRGEIDGKAFTIYNYKTGRNYNGSLGIPTNQLKGSYWHIGGFNRDIVDVVVNYMAEHHPGTERETKDELIGRIKNWIRDYEKTQPRNVMIDDDSFEGSAYFLLQSVLKELKQ